MKRIGIIPARSGSKRLEGKNSLPFCGMTLVEISVRCALASRVFDKIIITSDDFSHKKNEEISKLVEFHSRPSLLATDETTSVDVLKYICNHFSFKKEDLICMLQPTSPLRLQCDIQKSMGNSSVSVCVKSGNNNWLRHSVVEIYKKYNISNYHTEDVGKYASNLYFNGAVYWISVNELFLQNLLFSEKTKLFVMPEYRSIDIDLKQEFDLAEKRFKALDVLKIFEEPLGVEFDD